MPTSHTLTLADGLRLRYFAAGDAGPALILLHGGGTDSAALSWGGLVDRLAHGRRVFAPDLPGYGESDRPAHAPYTLDYFADVALRLADALGLDTFDVVGLSMGGGISLTLALNHADRIRRLILVDTYGLQATYPPQFLSYLLVRVPFLTELTYASARTPRMARLTLGQFIRTPDALTEDLVAEIVSEAGKPRAGQAFNAFQRYETQRRGLRSNYLPRLGEVAAPTLIVHGAADTLVPLSLAEEACRRIPDCRLKVLAGAGHWSQRERPEEFAEAVEGFLG